jgi:diketogulonate reductase-like aldo/keto reductase
MGKTHILEKFLRDQRSDSEFGRSARVPIACVQMPPYPHERDFYQEVLTALGTVVPDGMSVALDVMRGIAETHGVSVAQIALAWLLHQKVVSSVLVGAKRMDQLEENLRAVNVSLSDEEQTIIAEVSKIPAEYPAWMIELWSHSRQTQLANSSR